MDWDYDDSLYRFNTSHVTLYRLENFATPFPFASFNTSHVTLYPPEDWWSQDLDGRFNTSHVTLYLAYIEGDTVQFLLFQYISCYSLSRWGEERGKRSSVSIHLMLLFIKFHYVPNILINIVSIHLMLLFIMTPEYTAAHNDGFNTSHVTLYQYAIILTVQERMFQYISCYSLSTVYRPRHIWLRAFQYISCYSLSIY